MQDTFHHLQVIANFLYLKYYDDDNDKNNNKVIVTIRCEMPEYITQLALTICFL